MKFLRYVLWVAGFVTLKSGIQLTGFDSGTGTVVSIVGVAMLVGAYLWGRAAKKAAQAVAPKA